MFLDYNRFTFLVLKKNLSETDSAPILTIRTSKMTLLSYTIQFDRGFLSSIPLKITHRLSEKDHLIILLSPDLYIRIIQLRSF